MLAEYAPGFIEEGIPRIRSEFLLYGKAYPPKDLDSKTFDCGVRLADMAKKARVLGRRVLQGSSLLVDDPVGITDVNAENCYGGPEYPLNDRGTGHPSSRDERNLLFLPTLELITHPWHRDPERNHPALFGALDISHPQRQGYAGTYSDEWLKTDYPGLPQDASWRLYNTASENQQQENPFEGDETYDLINLSQHSSHIRGKLPGIKPRIVIRRDGQSSLEELPPLLRSVVFLPEADKMVLIWQSQCKVSTDDASDIDLIAFGFEHKNKPKQLSHYHQIVSDRLDEEDGIFAMLDDSGLVPEEFGYDPLLPQSEQPEEDPNSMSARLKKRISASMKEGYDEVVLHELDPAEHGPPEKLPEPPPTPPLRDMGPYMRKLLERSEAQLEKAKQKQKEEVAETAQILDKNEMDGKLIEKEVRGELGAYGPPKSVAKQTRDDLEVIDCQAKEQGETIDEVQQMLGDKELHAEWKNVDKQLMNGYRQGAHLQAEAPGTVGEEMQRQRLLVEEYVKEGRSLSGLDLTGANLSGMNLDGQDFSDALMESVSFRNASLKNAKFINTVLAHGDLRDAVLEGCDFSQANLGKADLSCANATGAVFTDTELMEAVLTEATLRKAKFNGAQLHQVNFSKADLAYADLSESLCFESNLDGASLDGCCLNETQFIDSVLTQTNWRGSKGENAVFLNIDCSFCDFSNSVLPGSRWVGDVDLTEADFSGADINNVYFAQDSQLPGVSFYRANLSEAILSSCRLSGANLAAAVLKETALKDADLQNADMRQVNIMEGSLQNADLSGADLTGAHLYGTDLVRIVTDNKTKADGVIHTNARIHPRLERGGESA